MSKTETTLSGWTELVWGLIATLVIVGVSLYLGALGLLILLEVIGALS